MYYSLINSMNRASAAPSYPVSQRLFIDPGNPLSYSGSGTTVTDLSGYSNNATLVNGVGYSTSNGGIFTLDNTNDNISTPLYATLSNMSCIAWIKISSYKQDANFIMCDVGAQYSVFGVNSSGKLYWGNYGSTPTVGATTIALNTWYCVGFNHKTGQKGQVYLNGVLDGQSSVNANNIGSNTFSLKIGTNGIYYFDGSIGVYQLYNNSITSSDFALVFNNFKSRYGY
jgi:hypothetical protein